MEMQMVLRVSLSRYRDRDDRISTFLGDGPLSVDARPARQTAGFFRWNKHRVLCFHESRDPYCARNLWQTARQQNNKFGAFAMKLLDEIIELLSDRQASLSAALLKTKVLMHRIGHKELADWVNDELRGYDKDKPVPAYRIIPTRLVGNYQNIAYRATEQTLPTGHLPEKLRKDFSRDELRQSVEVLEKQTQDAKGSLIRPIAPEFYGAIEKAFVKGNWIDSAWIQMEPTQLLNTLVEIRSRLLDFALNLQDELGDMPEDDMKEAAKGIDANGIFHAAVFGDNTTIIVGNENKTTVTNTVTKGDFKSLAETFRKAGVEEADIVELDAAVREDDAAAVVATKQYGPRVKTWMATMTGKAIDGVWALGLSAGAQVLGTAIGAYYGIK